MKKIKKVLSIVLTLCMVLSLLPMTAQADVDPVMIVGTGYNTLTAALAAAVDGDVIKLNDHITESVSYTVSTGKTVTIDGQNNTLTGTSADTLVLTGTGTIKLKNITLVGPKYSNYGHVLYIPSSFDAVDVISIGNVSCIAGSQIDPTQYGFGYAVDNWGSGTVNVTSATGMAVKSVGVMNRSTGTVNVGTASVDNENSTAVYNDSTGVINVNSATGGTSGTAIVNDGSGTVNATAATAANGTVVDNRSTGAVNIGTALSSGQISNTTSGAVKTGIDTQTLGLYIGSYASGNSCVLNSITVASTGATTIGTLPAAVTQNGDLGVWYTDLEGNIPFSGTAIEGVPELNAVFFHTVSGKIIDSETGSGISGAAVQLHNPFGGAIGSPVMTAADGSFIFPSVRQGVNYTISVSKSGYVDGCITSFNVSSNVTKNLVLKTVTSVVNELATTISAISGLTTTVTGSTVSVTGSVIATATTGAFLTLEIPSSVKILWKASLSGSNTACLLQLTGDGTFEVADGANIDDDITYGIYCGQGNGHLIVSGGKVSAKGSNSTAIYIDKNWLLTMTGGEVSVIGDKSAAIIAGSPAVIVGGTVSDTGTGSYPLLLADTSAWRGDVITSGGIYYYPSGIYADVSINAAVTQALSGTSTGLTVTGHNLPSAEDRVTAVWAIQNGVNGVNISYYSTNDPTIAMEEWFLAVPGVTVAATHTVTFNKNGGDTEANPATKAVESGASVSTLPASPTRSGYTFTGWNTAADGSGAAYTASVIIKSDITVYAQWSKNSSTGTGGSTTMTNPTTTVSGSTAITTVMPTVSGGVATGSVTESQMNDALAKAKTAAGSSEMPKVKIEVGGVSGASSVGTTIPHSSMQVFVSGVVGTLTISGPTGSVSFGADALKTITGTADSDVTVTMAKTDSSQLSDVAKALVGSHPVFTFSVTSGGKTISQFNGAVAVSVPYTPAAGEDLNAIVIYYIGANGELKTVTNGHYDAATGTVIFTTTHFSTYDVGYNKVSFTDVSNTAWYEDAVTFLAARGVTSGTTDTTFSPDATLTRGQFITMLLRAYGISADANPKDNFADAGNTYYTGYLAAGKRLGIADGVGNNRFAPKQVITRQEMFTLLYKALKVLNQLPSGASGKTLTDFSDASDIASWAKDAVTLLVKTDTVSGSGGKLSPTDTTTRAEMAQVLYSLLSK